MAKEPSMDQAFLQKLTEVVEQNLDNDQFGVEDLARETGMSRSKLHRKLRKLSGQSGSQFIRETRLEHAMEMLRQDVATASEIAYRVGFNSPAYFSKSFHDYYGFPPGEAKEKDLTSMSEVKAGHENSKKKLSFKIKRLWLPISVGVILILFGTSYLYQSIQTSEIKPSIAVLPLDNLTGDDEQEYFVDGIHDALIGELGKISNLRVISRTSTLQFGNPDINMQEIAEKLGVNNILEGSVYRAEDSIRIQLQLIQTDPEERHLWSKAFNRDMNNVLSMLNDVTLTVASDINTTLTPQEQERLNKTVSINPEMYKAYLRGMFYLNKGTPGDIQKGINYLYKAVEEDPADPTAYAGLAHAYISLGHGATPSHDAFRKAKAAALIAISLDSTIAEAHSALGSYKLYYEHDWLGAENAFRYANKLNPNLPWNHYHYAWFLNLAGRKKEAISEHELALELDPLNPYINGWMAWLYAKYGYYELSEQEVENTLMLDENHPIGLIAQGLLYTQQKKYNEALIAFKKANAVNPSWQWLLGNAYCLVGEINKAREILSKIEQKDLSSYNAFERAAMYAVLGETDKAFQWLSYEPPHAYIPWIPRHNSFDSLHKDPRFDEFLIKYNLSEMKDVPTYTSR